MTVAKTSHRGASRGVQNLPAIRQREHQSLAAHRHIGLLCDRSMQDVTHVNLAKRPDAAGGGK
jgi:hypothetical protein